MLKKYKAKSQINICVHTADGANIHVSFQPKTGGGSVFFTDNETLQAGLESHPRFGKLFRFDCVMEEKPVVVEPVAEEAEGARTMEFRNNDDAKDYLAEKFGLSRSKLRTRAAIEQAAAANGIEIAWTE